MHKRRYLLIVLLAGLGLVFLWYSFWYFERQERLSQRHHLLCEILKPGMSKDEVLNTLKQAGEFGVVGGEDQGSNFEIHIAFTDPNGKEVYGAFELGFNNDKYSGAYILGFDTYDSICDFRFSTPNTKETPVSSP